MKRQRSTDTLATLVQTLEDEPVNSELYLIVILVRS